MTFSSFLIVEPDEFLASWFSSGVTERVKSLRSSDPQGPSVASMLPHWRYSPWTLSESGFSARVNLSSEFHTARLVRKECLSPSAQCFHVEFAFESGPDFRFLPGQFVSVVASDPAGKEQTRAYSIASAHGSNRFDLCLNRVPGGFVSNHLCDLEIGETIRLYGPNGFFVLREPVTDSILIATGTGIAPMRSFTQSLFSRGGMDRSGAKEVWLVHGTRNESDLYYREEFEALAARCPNFHYFPTLSRADEGWRGLRGYVQDHAVGIIEERAVQFGTSLSSVVEGTSVAAPDLHFKMYAYVCGLSRMISSVRERLKSLGLHRKQIVVERYD